MIETVTISISRFKELEAIEKVFNEKLIIYRGRWGDYHTTTESRAIEDMQYSVDQLKKDILRLKNRNLIERILNR